MFGSLGLPEIILILVIALLVFGPKRLPEVGRTIGRGLAEFRRASTDLKRSVNAELSLEEEERSASSRRPSYEVPGIGRTSREASTAREIPSSEAAAEGSDPEPTGPPGGTAPREEPAPARPSGDREPAADPPGSSDPAGSRGNEAAPAEPEPEPRPEGS